VTVTGWLAAAFIFLEISLFFGLGGIVWPKLRGTIRGKWRAGGKKPDLLQVLVFFEVFVRGCGVLGMRVMRYMN
jgi:hypothetical protein